MSYLCDTKLIFYSYEWDLIVEEKLILFFKNSKNIKQTKANNL